MALEPDEFRSILERINVQKFGVRTFSEERIVPVGTTRVSLLRNNPNRIFWICINESLNPIRVSNANDVSTTSGWLLQANGGIISMWWEEDGEGVGYELFAIAGVAANNVRIREVSGL